MTTTIKISINGVYGGFEYKSSPEYRPEFGYWVIVRFGDISSRIEWRKTYAELQSAISERYGIMIPDGDTLHWVNYGAPYNTANFNN